MFNQDGMISSIKAAVKSSRTRKECLPLLACIKMSFVTLSRAFSVLCIMKRLEFNDNTMSFIDLKELLNNIFMNGDEL